MKMGRSRIIQLTNLLLPVVEAYCALEVRETQCHARMRKIKNLLTKLWTTHQTRLVYQYLVFLTTLSLRAVKVQG